MAKRRQTFERAARKRRAAQRTKAALRKPLPGDVSVEPAKKSRRPSKV
jgi:hypothetical protein